MNLEVKIIENLHFLQIHIDELYHAVPIELMAIENHFDGEKWGSKAIGLCGF